MKTNEETEKKQQLHRELMVMKSDYDDLSKKMDDWSKRFNDLWIKSNNKLNEKEVIK